MQRQRPCREERDILLPLKPFRIEQLLLPAPPFLLFLPDPGRRRFPAGQAVKSAACRAKHQFVECFGAVETDFTFRRVHIDVKPLRRRLQQDHCQGMTPPGQHAAVGPRQRPGQQRALDDPPVDHNRDPAPGSPGELRHAQVALEQQPGRGIAAAQRQHRRSRFAPVEGADGMKQGAVPGGAQHRPPIADELEGAGRVSQGHAGEQGADAGQFPRAPAQKFLTPRGVVEEILHQHSGAFGSSHLRRRQSFPSLHLYLHRRQILPAPRGQGHPGHGADARQRFAAKAQAGNSLQLLQRSDLAGGKARESERHLCRGDAAAVVNNADGPLPPFNDAHLETAGPGIQGVFHQFLYHRGGMFNNFTGGNLLGSLQIQNPDHYIHIPLCSLSRPLLRLRHRPGTASAAAGRAAAAPPVE